MYPWSGWWEGAGEDGLGHCRSHIHTALCQSLVVWVPGKMQPV
jgi:hypothetical protein